MLRLQKKESRLARQISRNPGIKASFIGDIWLIKTPLIGGPERTPAPHSELLITFKTTYPTSRLKLNQALRIGASESSDGI